MRIDVEQSGDPGRAFETLSNAYAPEIVRAAGNFSTQAYQHTKLTLREIEAARYRTAQINGCLVCQGFRAGRDFPQMFEGFGGDLESSVYRNGPAPDEEFYAQVENWRDWPGYSDRERLAIHYAEGMGEAPKEIAADEEFWARAKAVFSDEEIVDLTYCIGSWIANGRAAHVLGLDTACSFVVEDVGNYILELATMTHLSDSRQAGVLSQDDIDAAICRAASDLSVSIGESVPLLDYRDSLVEFFSALGCGAGSFGLALLSGDIDPRSTEPCGP